MNGTMVSIIIPVYNTQEYLKDCLDSVINQSYSNIEIIIINDGSTDDSHAICIEYAEKDKRIIFIDKENEGVSAARNTGIDISKGEWIYFLDSDDFIELKMFSKLLMIVDNTDCDVIQFGLRSYKNNAIVRYNIPSEYREYLSEDLNIFLKENELKPVSACLHFFESKLIKNNKIRFDERLKHGEDMLFVYSAYCCYKKLVVLNNFFYNQVVREESASRKKMEVKIIKDSLLFLSELCSFIRKKKMTYEYREEINDLLKLFFVKAAYFNNYRQHKKDFQEEYSDFYLKNRDILYTSFSKLGSVNIDLVILPLIFIHKLRGLR